MTFKVMSKQCDQCLYGPNKIVSDARRRQILRSLSREDNHFICHKATLVGQDIACRADWDKRCGGQLGRIAERLGAAEFVSEDTLTPLE